jgi:hypothetical protein
MDIYKLLEIIEERPAMYMGKKSIIYLDVFIHGYLTALEFNSIEKGNPPFYQFTDWIRRKYKYKFSSMGWARLLLEKTKDEVIAVDEFYKLLKEFRKRILIEKKQVLLTSEHKSTGVSRFFTNGKELPVPIPKMIKIVQYLPDRGVYLSYIQQDGKVTTHHYFKTQQEAMEKANKEFGVRREEWSKIS